MSDKNWCYLVAHPNKKVKIDTEDFERVNKHSWRITYGTTGRPRVVSTFQTPKGPRQVTLGKFLMSPPKGKQVYPRRFNEGLDYRKNNLVVCTLKERQQLLPKKRTVTTSKFRGVSFLKSKSLWRAGIEVEGRAITLGNFKTEEDAAEAYNAAARKYFGSHAYQNPVGRKPTKRNL